MREWVDLGCAVMWRKYLNCGYAPMDDLGCAVNYVLSCQCFRFLLLFFRSLLGHLKKIVMLRHILLIVTYFTYSLICAFQVLHYSLYFSSVKLSCVN